MYCISQSCGFLCELSGAEAAAENRELRNKGANGTYQFLVGLLMLGTRPIQTLGHNLKESRTKGGLDGDVGCGERERGRVDALQGRDSGRIGTLHSPLNVPKQPVDPSTSILQPDWF